MKNVTLLAGGFTALIWVGIPFYIMGLGMQVIHINTLLLVLAFGLNKIRAGEYWVIRLAAPLVWHVGLIFLGIGFLLTGGLLSSLFAKNIFEVVKYEVGYLVGVSILFIFIASINTEKSLQFLLQCLVVGGVITVLLALLGLKVAPLHITYNQYGRAKGLLLHPNQLGMMLAAIMPLVLARLAADYRRGVYWFTLTILTVGLVLSGSKTNLLLTGMMVLITLTVVSVTKQQLSDRIISLVGAGFVIFLLGWIVFFLLQQLAPTTLSNLELIWQDPKGYRSVISRKEIWQEALAIVEHSPNFGIGAGNSWIYLGKNHAHNVFIDYYLTMGRFGLGAFFIFLLSVISLCSFALRLAFSMAPDQKAQVIGLTLGIVSYIISNQLSDSFGGTTLSMLWVLIAALVSSINIWLQNNITKTKK